MGEFEGSLFTKLIRNIYQDDDYFFIEPQFLMLLPYLVYSYSSSYSVSLAG